MRLQNYEKAIKKTPKELRDRFQTIFDPDLVTPDQLRQAMSAQDFSKTVDSMIGDLGEEVFLKRTVDLPTREAYRIELFNRVGPQTFDEVMERLYALRNDSYDVVDLRPQRMALDDEKAWKKLILSLHPRYQEFDDQIPLYEDDGKLLNLVVKVIKERKMKDAEAEEFKLGVMRHSYYARGRGGTRINRMIARPVPT